MKRIILASASPRRKELLKKIGLKFTVDASKYKEDSILNMPPKKLANFLSLQKAKDVAKRYKNAIVIAADTLVVLGNEILGKPHTETGAKKMLMKLNGKVHLVITGFAIVDTDTNKTVTKSVETKVYFKQLTVKEIDNYVKTKEPLDKAGAYGIQEKASAFVEKIEGDFFNVVGLPLNALTCELKKFG